MRQILLLVFLCISATLYGQEVNLMLPNGHAKAIEAISSTSDGKYIATAAYKTVLIWEVASGKKIHEIELDFTLLANEINTIAITDKLDKVLVAANGGTACFDIQTGKRRFSLPGVYGAAFSKDGTKIFNVDGDHLQIVNSTTGAVETTLSNTLISGKSFKFFETANNKLLVVNNYGWAIIDQQTKTLVFKQKIGYEQQLRFAAYTYHQNSNLIIAAANDSLKSFNASTGKLLKAKAIAPNYICYGLSATDKDELVVFNEDFKAKNFKTEVLKITDFTPIRVSIQGQAEVPQSIYYGNTCFPIAGTSKIIYNNYLEINTYDYAKGVYDVPFSNKIVDFKAFFYYRNLTQRIQADHRLDFSTEDNAIRNISLATFKPEKFIPATTAKSIVYSTDGKLTAAIGRKTTVSNPLTGAVIRTITLANDIDPEIESFFFSFDGSKLIYTNKDKGNLIAIDLKTGIATTLITVGSHLGQCTSSFDGKYFATVSSAKGIEYLSVYNLLTKQMVLNKRSCDPYKDSNCIRSVQFVNDSYTIVTTGGNAGQQTITLYQADQPTYLSSFPIKAANPLTILGGDSKSKLIAIGEVGQFQMGSYNLKIINFEGKVIKEFNSVNHSDYLKVAFSKDNKMMLAVTTKKGIQVWNFEKAELLGTYYFIEKTNEYIFVSTEDLFDGSTAGMKELYFVRNHQPISLDKLYEQFYTPDILRRKINGEQFTRPDISNLHDAPKVRINYAAVQRNLTVGDDISIFQNTTGTAEITVKANAPDDSIDEIRLFHNGKIVTLGTRNLIVADEKSASAEKKYTIQLLAGPNHIRAIALNSQRTESDPDQIVVNYNQGNNANNLIQPNKGNTQDTPIAPIDKEATLHLVIIGINQYQNNNMNLNYAIADATALKDELIKDANTIVKAVKTYFITDLSADKPGITKAFLEVQKTAKAQDVFIFYYAGHGVIGKDKEFYLVPTDVSDLKNVQQELVQKGISAKLLQQYAVDIQAQKQLFILDACQSAGAFEKMLAENGDQQKTIALVARSTGTHWMAASGAQQFAQEFTQLGHGAFTYVLLQALKGEAAQNKLITVNGLKNFLQVQIPVLMKKYNGAEQYPASYGLGYDFPVSTLK